MIYCAKFDLNWRYFLYVFNSFNCVLSFEQAKDSFTQGCFVPCLVESKPLVLEKRIFKRDKWFFTIWLDFPLGKRRDPPIEQARIPSNQEYVALVQV